MHKSMTISFVEEANISRNCVLMLSYCIMSSHPEVRGHAREISTMV
jgi:hypothetical protein